MRPKEAGTAGDKDATAVGVILHVFPTSKNKYDLVLNTGNPFKFIYDFLEKTFFAFIQNSYML